MKFRLVVKLMLEIANCTYEGIIFFFFVIEVLVVLTRLYQYVGIYFVFIVQVSRAEL